MVLDREDGELEAAVAKGPCPLVGVEARGLEDVGVLVARAPFEAGEGVDPEVQERGLLKALPGDLPFRGPDLGCLGDDIVRGVVGADRDAEGRFRSGGQWPCPRGRVPPGRGNCSTRRPPW
ncbi:hypothetical protein GCM10010449_78350 [Streptomyces rectiviolaceus]|uniref:Uncharacterized protein n=1 Tax=Streptomyces rectiviolaceus TaxID=332591 RepID=A0ABP6NHC0_9ACTN